MIRLTYINFKISNKKIERKNIEDDYTDKEHCCFYFKEHKWGKLEKYVIFWDENNKTTIKYLGKGQKIKCKIPETLNEVFSIQVYANDDFKTNKITIGRIIEKKKKDKHHDKNKKENRDPSSIFYDIYSQLEQKIDRIDYKDNVFSIYSSNKLIKQVDLFDKTLIKKLIDEQLIEVNVDSSLSLTSKNPVQNKIITEELNKKQNSSSLPRVAITGDYKDLKNIPHEFNPTHHNHVVVDVVDYEENIDFDLGKLLDILNDEIRKE